MVTISRTNIDIFPLNLGANPFGWTAERQASFDILDAFVAAGGNFIDTADVYSAWGEGNSGGESEEVLGAWLRERPDAGVTVATKSGKLQGVSGRGRDATYRAVEGSLRRLGLERIDVFYYHCDDDAVSIAEQVDIASALIADGKVRYLALSNYSPERTREFFEAARGTDAMPVAIQPQYHLLHRGDYEQGYAPLAGEFGVSVFPYFSLASGLLTGKYRSEQDLQGSAREAFASGYLTDSTFAVIDELVSVADGHGAQPATVALAWLLAKGVTAPIASVSKVAQLDSLMAAPGLKLSTEEVARLDEVSGGASISVT